MPSTIYLARHAESVHNVTKDFNLRGPGLTKLGLTQASSLAASFPYLSSVAVVLTSPMRRAIETAIAGFGGIPNEKYLPCDAGCELEPSGRGSQAWILAHSARSGMPKRVRTRADDAAVAARARSARRNCKNGVPETSRDVVVVTHGVFMKFLAEDDTLDLPKAGWKAYKISSLGGTEPVLIPVG
ncbi:hypothetical protein VTK56DRAFT_7366 [Thermocarpiscus australiensis]